MSYPATSSPLAPTHVRGSSFSSASPDRRQPLRIATTPRRSRSSTNPSPLLASFSSADDPPLTLSPADYTSPSGYPATPTSTINTTTATVVGAVAAVAHRMSSGSSIAIVTLGPADAFSASVRKLERDIARPGDAADIFEAAGNVISAVPILQTVGSIVLFFKQMLDLAVKLHENRLAALGLVINSVEIVQAVQMQVRSSAARVSDVMARQIVDLFKKLSHNTELLALLSTRSKFKQLLYARRVQFKQLLYARRVQHDIETARNETNHFIQIFTLKTAVLHDQRLELMQQQVESEAAKDTQDHKDRLDYLARYPDRARNLIDNEEIPEVLLTLEREVDIQAEEDYRMANSPRPPSSAYSPIAFPEPHPYNPDSPTPPPPTPQLPPLPPPAIVYADAEKAYSELSVIQEGTCHLTVGTSDAGWTNASRRGPGLSERWAPGQDARREQARGWRQSRAWQISSEDWELSMSRGNFCKCLLHYLRAESAQSASDLPAWTITEFEIYRQGLICTSNFSKVNRGLWANQAVVIKELDKTADQALFRAEVDVWSCVSDNEYIVPFLGASSTHGNPPWFFVSPWMSNGHIINYLSSPAYAPKPSGLLPLIHQIALGMECLHSRGVLHGDFKGQNILVDDTGRARICDFGLSQIKIDITTKSLAGGKETEGQSNATGTLRFTAPERMMGESLGRKCDVYSFAMTAYQMYSGEVPFAALDATMARRTILEGIRPPQLDAIPAPFWDLLTQCWDANPHERPSFEQICQEMETMYDASEEAETGEESDGDVSETSGETIYVPPGGRAERAGEDVFRTARTRLSPAYESELVRSGTISDLSNTNHDPNSDDTDPQDFPVLIVPISSRGSDPSTPSSLPPTDPGSPSGYFPSPSSSLLARHELFYRKYFPFTNYSDRLNLPQWCPSLVDVGDVGFMKNGKVVPLASSLPRCIGVGPGASLPYVGVYKLINIKESRVYPTLMSDYAKDVVVKFRASFKRNNGEAMPKYMKTVRRQIGVPMKPGAKAVRLIVADRTLQMLTRCDESMRFLRDNVDTIIKDAREEHGDLERKDIMVVVGTLTATNYAMAVCDFSRHYTRSSEGARGVESYPGSDLGGRGGGMGPRLPGVDERPFECSVKTSKPNGPRNAVHLSVLRFPPNGGDPTFYRDV
ncbi:hypothetical protein IAT38_008302 [Cryptococcus sp. DSM 104549]